MQLTIYVPAPGAELGIDPKSAIVGLCPENGRIKVYFEGGRNGGHNMRLYTDRLMHAAGRLVQRYPTIALGWYPTEALVPVGLYDAANWRIVAISNAEALQQWLDTEALPEVFDPHERRFVLHARSAGFWSNQTGWGELVAATRFSAIEQTQFADHPMANRKDAVWLDTKPQS